MNQKEKKKKTFNGTNKVVQKPMLEKGGAPQILIGNLSIRHDAYNLG